MKQLKAAHQSKHFTHDFLFTSTDIENNTLNSGVEDKKIKWNEFGIHLEIFLS